ncbi:MAG: Fatty-acyl-CoA oxidase, related to yeast fatty acid beta-oxidation enzyme POX1 [uncultured Actinomycetospora sp.]|uniref:acyl-CoA oxidase n=1 Tax=uncultured Actinomycetospora sp. TaxID=1135996 RepID=A0A6J4K3K2_9PSEU|nr:MAG: Fatty-acyl-CoA oxidase, related to yeast fatty acid beta-oxidation enzyme POX1 [uncultured Actinomycetospora sp.]
MNHPSHRATDEYGDATAAAVQRTLDGRWHTLRDEIRGRHDFAELRVHPGTDVETYRAAIWEMLQRLADDGHAVHGFPAAVGGRGDIGGSVVSFEMLAFADLSLQVKSGVQWGLFGGAIQALGNTEQHARFLPGVMDLSLPGCFAMTETGHGSDVQSVHTTATYDPDTGEFVIDTPTESARKDYIGNAARDGKMAAVFVQLYAGRQGEETQRHGVHAVLVPLRGDDGAILPGVEITDDGHKEGLNGVDNGRLAFHGVRVPRENLLDRYGSVAEDGTYSSSIENETRRFFTMLGALVRGRVSVSGSAVGAASLAQTIAVRYGEARRQFAAPGGEEEIVVLDYLAHQRKLLPGLARTYALRFAQNELVEMLHDIQTTREAGGEIDEKRQRELESRAAGTKALTTWHATATIQACREACGGQGYLSENRLGQLRADTDVFTTFEGDNTVLLQLVAKGLISGYADDFGNLDTLGTVRFVADQVLDTVAERTSLRQLAERLRAVGPGREEDDVLDRSWQVKLLDDREEHTLDGLVRRLRPARDKGISPARQFAIFNNAQDHLLRAARSHLDGLVLDAFVRGIDGCVDPSARALLGKVCDLFALSLIEEDKGWFLEHGRISAARAKTVTAEVNRLCQELRPHARTLVDAFGIPEEWIGAPIATGTEDRRQEEARAHADSLR